LFRGLAAGSTVYESGVGAEDSPALQQTVTGVAPGNYDVYVAYWTDGDENCTVRAGLSPASMTLYNFSGAFGDQPGGQPATNAIKGITAAAVPLSAWSILPPTTPTGAYFTDGGTNDTFDRVMLLAKAGTTSPNASGEINVFIDDMPSNAAPGRRTWLDGVVYMPATAAPISLTATLDANTGGLTLTNPTNSPFQIKSYAITSVSGSLNAAAWTPIAGRLDSGGNGSFDVDMWQVSAPADPANTPFTNRLAESENPVGNGGALAASGGSISFGNVYRKNRFQDVQISLTLTDDSVVTLVPNYNGTAIAPGDFNLSGGPLTISDFQIMMSNMHTNMSSFTQAQAHLAGDMTGDRRVNFSDFAAFRAAYESQNGLGSFQQLVAQTPEPSSALLFCGASVLAIRSLRPRGRTLAMAVALCCMMVANVHAQALLKVDVDARAGDSSAGPPGPNTVAGFESFTINTAASGAVASASQTFASGYTLSFDVFDDGNPSDGGNPGDDPGKFDDRDRVSPDTAPTLNQLYDDFIFVGGSAGPTGGLDVRVSGGALVPNTPYRVSIYAYDGINSTGGSATPVREAAYFDGNNSNAPVLNTVFTTTTRPATDDTYKFSGVAVTDSTGQLFLKGRRVTAADVSVYIDGLEVNPFTGLTLEVNTTTGALRMLNSQSSPIDLSYYEIRSASGVLNPAAWTSLDDAEGGDPVGTGWDEAGGSNATILSEGNLSSMLTLNGSGGSVGLGPAFTLGGAHDLSFSYAAPGSPALIGGFVKYVTGGNVVADFNHDGTVNGPDLAVWKAAFGANANGDADGDGDSDGRDFLIWQRRLGATSSAASAGAVPEPAALGLLAISGVFVAFYRKRRSL
jgi:hypothetical protein